MNDYRLEKFDGIIFLSGFMATGKSTLGKIISKLLSKPFKDLDTVICEKEGKTIKEIFTEHGEKYFREKEKEYLLELTRNFKGVLALGGGALHNQQIVDHLKLSGIIVFINTPLEEILNRVLRRTTRPILYDAQGKIKSREALFNELKALYSTRIEFYQQAQIILEGSNGIDKNEQANILIEKLKRYV